MTVEEFTKLLDAHDWYYMYSDDHSAYNKGRSESIAIMNIMRGNKELGKIYEEYRKKD